MAVQLSCSLKMNNGGMETYWMKSIEDGLKKDRDPRIERTIQNVGTISDELFMRSHLDVLNENGKGRFSCRNKQNKIIQWRCERSHRPKGSSAGDPMTTRANSCPAYVSFMFKTTANFRGCIVRQMCEHSGHDVTNTNEKRMNRINEDLVEFIHNSISQGLSNSAILLKSIDWSQSQGKTDLMDRTFFVSPEDIARIRASFNRYIRMDANDCVSVDKLIQSELKDSILFYQPLSQSEPLMIVYSSRWQLEQLKQFGGHMLFLDATYKSITQYGFAFYAVMVKNDTGKGVPVSFFILSEETTTILEACLRKLKEAAGDLTPRCVMVDKDQKEINAIKTVFPHASVLLCWFHVLQAIHRWLVKQDGGHVQDPAVRNIIFQGVFSLKQCRTEKQFHQTASTVLQNIHKVTGSDRVLNYLKDNWIKCGAMWSNFGRMFFHHQSETNNVVERFFFGIKYNFLGGYCNRRLDDLLLILHNHVVKYYCHLDELKLAGRVPSQVLHPDDSDEAAERMGCHGLEQNVCHLSGGLFRVPSDETENIHTDDTLPQNDRTGIAQPQHTDTAQPRHCIRKMLKDLSSYCDGESYKPSLVLYNSIKAAHQLAFGRFKTQSKKRKIERLHKYRKAIELTKRKIASAHKYPNNPEKQIHCNPTANKDGAFKPKGSKRKRSRKF